MSASSSAPCGGVALGVTVEERGVVSHLLSGSFVRSLQTDVQFEPNDIASRGLTMIEDQRRHGIVAGFCEHSRVRQGEFRSQTQRRWGEDHTEIVRTTVQAKIGTLQVNTIHIAGTRIAKSSCARRFRRHDVLDRKSGRLGRDNRSRSYRARRATSSGSLRSTAHLIATFRAIHVTDVQPSFEQQQE